MIDLDGILFKERNKRRGDELATHASDIWTCLRAVALRRRGEHSAPLKREELVKFQAGHDYEYGLARTLREAGHTVEHDPEKFVASGFGLDIIHPDILVDNELMIEAKNTDARKPKDECQPHHAVQVSVSALAVARQRGLEPLRAIVRVKHASHIERDYEVAPAALEPQIQAMADRVVALTGPDQPLPPPEPTSWLPYDECGYCRWVQCPKNPKRNGMTHP